MKSRTRSHAGFTLIEVLIVVVIMAVLAATIIPQFSSSTQDAKEGTLKFNLHTLRSQIELYKLQHKGALPAVDASSAMPGLTKTTKADGTVDATGTLGPYIMGGDLPANPLNGKITVQSVAGGTWPPTGDDSHGWVFNTVTGQIIADSAGKETF